MRDPLAAVRICGHDLIMLAAAHPITLAALTLAAAVLLVAGRAVLGWWRHRRLCVNARLVTILPPPTADLSGAHDLWRHLQGLLRPRWARLITGIPHLGWEIRFTPAGITFQLWVPGTLPPGQVERAVTAAWPGAQTRTRPAHQHPPPPGQRAHGGRLVLALPDHHPLRTRFDTDPLRGLLATARSLHHGESVLVQVLARPVTGRRLRAATRYANQLRHGHTPTLKTSLFDLILPIHSSTPTGPVRVETAEQVRAICRKATEPRFAVTIRYCATTTNTTPAGRAWLRGRGGELASALQGVLAADNHLRRHHLNRPAKVLRSRRLGRGMLLSVSELAALCHLPLDETVPGLARSGAHPTPPPPGIPTTGPDVRLLGDSDAGGPRPVAVRVQDARQHTHLLGGTGAGKSTLLTTMQLSDAHAGRALVSIEAKGDSTQLLSRLPETLAGKVVVIDPDDPAPPPCINILDAPGPELTTETVVGIFRRIYADFWGPRTDDILRAAVLTIASPHAVTRSALQAGGGRTLASVPRLLTDDPFRHHITRTIHNPFLRDFWTWYDHLTPAARSQVIGPVMNKLRAVLLRGFARQVLAAGPSTVNITHLLDHGGILLARLPKGSLGEDTARLLGSMILAKVWQAVQARATTPEHQRADCAIYLDEAHNFLTLPNGIDDMLAEARSHRAALIIAHQNLAQLPRDLREAVSANARNKIYLSASPEDAHTLHHHLHPALTEHDLSHLDAFQAAVRLVHHNALTQAFTLRTRPLPPPIPSREEQIRAASRARYGTPPAPGHTALIKHDPRPS